jgi:hypothetical protein
MAKKEKDQKLIVTMPDLGLNTRQISALKKKFKAEVVSSLGGSALASRIIIIIIFC